MLGLVLVVEDIHQHSDKVELSKALVHGHPDVFIRVDSIIVLDQLVMRATHPGEAELVADSRIDKHRKNLDYDLMEGSDLARAGSLKHLAEHAYNVLVN